jgi:peptidoglycan biosynthesis protein MviN/MurJ (putative lipid II flippase)
VLYITIVAFILAIVFLTAGFARGDYWPALLVIVIGIVVGTGMT